MKALLEAYDQDGSLLTKLSLRYIVKGFLESFFRKLFFFFLINFDLSIVFLNFSPISSDDWI